jgi:hypothetical protein
MLPWTNKEDVKARATRDLASTSPELIVDVSGGEFDLSKIFPEVRGFISRNYHILDRRIGATIYERNDGGGVLAIGPPPR